MGFLEHNLGSHLDLFPHPYSLEEYGLADIELDSKPKNFVSGQMVILKFFQKGGKKLDI